MSRQLRRRRRRKRRSQGRKLVAAGNRSRRLAARPDPAAAGRGVPGRRSQRRTVVGKPGKPSPGRRSRRRAVVGKPGKPSPGRKRRRPAEAGAAEAAPQNGIAAICTTAIFAVNLPDCVFGSQNQTSRSRSAGSGRLIFSSYLLSPACPEPPRRDPSSWFLMLRFHGNVRHASDDQIRVGLPFLDGQHLDGVIGIVRPQHEQPSGRSGRSLA
jgi:hypothetical protein